MTDTDNEYRTQQPGPKVFLLTAALGASISMLLATFVLELTSVWLSLPLGAACSVVGLFMGENIGDAIVFTVVVALIVLLVLTVLPVIPPLRRVIIPVAAGFCLGKLVSGVWKELSLRKNARA